MAEKCWVCNSEININDTKCPVCGFADLHKDFISKEDAENWMKTVVEPYRVKYNERCRNFQKPVYDNSIFDKDGSYRIGNNYKKDQPKPVADVGKINNKSNMIPPKEVDWGFVAYIIALIAAVLFFVISMATYEYGDPEEISAIAFITLVIVIIIPVFWGSKK